jgi:glycerol kinase
VARQPFILAIDQGTTNTKALLMARSGDVAASASSPLAISFPQPGWVEQDATALWNSVVEAADACIQQVEPAEIAAIGISNQRESAVVWDRRTGRPAGPCVIWQCRRTAAICAQLRESGQDSFIQERSGLAIDPLFSASKIAWLLDHVEDGRRRAARGELCAGTVDSWLLWNLTGGATHSTDASNASRTQLLNLQQAAWDSDLTELFHIPVSCLPEVRPSSGVFGHTVAVGRVPAGVPVGSLIGDSHAALFGHAAFVPGMAKATYGTGSSLMTLTEAPVASRHGLSTTIAWAAGGRVWYALEGNITNTGGTVQWLGDFLGLPNPAEGIADLAATVPQTDGVYLVPAFAGLGAPHWDAGARGLIFGLTRGSAAGHVARAAVESIAYQIRDVFEAMGHDAGIALPVLLADGGASRNNLLMQFQSDILDRPVIRSKSADLSARGAAWLAGLAVGFWNSPAELAALSKEGDRFTPSMAPARRTELLEGWSDALARSRSRTPGVPALG